jgi:DNA repair protein RecN (Recombination protein N)
VTARIRALGMPDAVLTVAVEPRPEHAPVAAGADRVDFLFSANPGQAPRPLAKVASGGELSRLSLAIQVASLGAESAPTLVFDEVDVGIGGRVAEIVGRELRNLSAVRQILCVTHLAQVAALAHQHCVVVKRIADGETDTHVAPVEEAGRVGEIARMLGGIEITPQILAHAAEILAAARAR